jgi:hypothetical protein
LYAEHVGWPVHSGKASFGNNVCVVSDNFLVATSLVCGRAESNGGDLKAIMKTLTSTQFKKLKLEAKKQARDAGIPLYKVQNTIANAHGYSNWALLSKFAGPVRVDATERFAFDRSVDEMRAAMRNQPDTLERVPGRHARPYVTVPDIWSKFRSPQHVVEFAIDYMTALLAVQRFQVGARSQAYWEMRLWLPYVVETAHGTAQLLANREYKPVGMDTTEHVDYNKFSAFHTKMHAEQIDAFSHRLTGHGYLYGDNPWSSRKAAETYLKRLEKLRTALA